MQVFPWEMISFRGVFWKGNRRSWQGIMELCLVSKMDALPFIMKDRIPRMGKNWVDGCITSLIEN